MEGTEIVVESLLFGSSRHSVHERVDALAFGPAEAYMGPDRFWRVETFDGSEVIATDLSGGASPGTLALQDPAGVELEIPLQHIRAIEAMAPEGAGAEAEP